MAVTINQILRELEELSLEDQEYVKETFDKMLSEAKREELHRMSEEAFEDYRAGRSKEGTVAELLKDLND